jgi:hypothetical protein
MGGPVYLHKWAAPHSDLLELGNENFIQNSAHDVQYMSADATDDSVATGNAMLWRVDEGGFCLQDAVTGIVVANYSAGSEDGSYKWDMVNHAQIITPQEGNRYAIVSARESNSFSKVTKDKYGVS